MVTFTLCEVTKTEMLKWLKDQEANGKVFNKLGKETGWSVKDTETIAGCFIAG